MRYILVAIALTLLTACAQPVWFKAGATNSDFGADRYSCMQNSFNNAPTVGGVSAYGSSSGTYGGNSAYSSETQDLNAQNRDQLFAACMQAKGWNLQKQPSQQTQPAQSSKQLPVTENKDVTFQKGLSGTVNNPIFNIGQAESAICAEKKKNGIFKTFAEVSKCNGEAFVRTFQSLGYPYMDIVEEFNKKRLSIEKQLDAGEITLEEEAIQLQAAQLEGVAEEIKRNSTKRNSKTTAAN